MKMSLADLGFAASLCLVKCIILVYDVCTFLIYCLLRKSTWSSSTATSSSGTSDADPITLNSESLAYGCHSVNELMQRVTMRFKDRRCIGFRDLMMEENKIEEDGTVVVQKILSQNFRYLNYAQVDKKIEDVMNGLVAKGIKTGESVMILMENRYEYLMMIHACMRMAVIPLLVNYRTTSASIQSIILQSSPVCIISSHRMIDKALNIAKGSCCIRLVVSADDNSSAEVKTRVTPADGEGQELQMIRLSELMSLGSECMPSRRVQIKLSDLAFVAYKSLQESSDAPEGVMVTHKNLISAVYSLDTALSGTKLLKSLSKRSAYPAITDLTHLSELVMQHVMLMNGITVAYSSKDSFTQEMGCLKSGVKSDVSILKPELICCSVQDCDSIRQQIERSLKQRSKFAKDFFDFCLEYKLFWNSQGFQTPLMNSIIFRKINKRLGGRVKLIIVPVQDKELLHPSTEDFVRAVMNAVLVTGNACYEATGFMTLNSGARNVPVPGLTVKVDKQKEVLIKGQSCSKGYYLNGEATEKRYIRDGQDNRWFKTHLVGEFDKNKSSLQVTDRIENLVTLQMSKQPSSLGQAEAVIRSCHYVNNVCIYADSGNNFIIALVSPDKKAITKLCNSLDIEEGSLDYREMCMDPEIQAEVTTAIIQHGLRCGLNKKSLPTKVKLCSEDWTPDSGLVDPDMKPIRRNIVAKYQRDISRMFGNIDHNRNVVSSSARIDNNNDVEIRDNNLPAVLPVEHSNGTSHSRITVPVSIVVRSPTPTSLDGDDDRKNTKGRESIEMRESGGHSNPAFED